MKDLHANEYKPDPAKQPNQYDEFKKYLIRSKHHVKKAQEQTIEIFQSIAPMIDNQI
jgi:hypothetical protein